VRQLGIIKDRVDAQKDLVMSAVRETADRLNSGWHGTRAFLLAYRHGAVLS